MGSPRKKIVKAQRITKHVCNSFLSASNKGNKVVKEIKVFF